MKYDFTSIMDRRGKDAIAVDMPGQGGGFAPDAPKEGFDLIPMWVADMNFPTVPTIPQAIIARAQHPAYGYFEPTDAYFDSIVRWAAWCPHSPALLPRAMPCCCTAPPTSASPTASRTTDIRSCTARW